MPKTAIIAAFNTDAEVAKIDSVKVAAAVTQVIDAGARQQASDTIEQIKGVTEGLKTYLDDNKKAQFAAQVAQLAALVDYLNNLRVLAEAARK